MLITMNRVIKAITTSKKGIYENRDLNLNCYFILFLFHYFHQIFLVCHRLRWKHFFLLEEKQNNEGKSLNSSHL